MKKYGFRFKTAMDTQVSIVIVPMIMMNGNLD